MLYFHMIKMCFWHFDKPPFIFLHSIDPWLFGSWLFALWPYFGWFLLSFPSQFLPFSLGFVVNFLQFSSVKFYPFYWVFSSISSVFFCQILPFLLGFLVNFFSFLLSNSPLFYGFSFWLQFYFSLAQDRFLWVSLPSSQDVNFLPSFFF